MPSNLPINASMSNVRRTKRENDSAIVSRSWPLNVVPMHQALIGVSAQRLSALKAFLSRRLDSRLKRLLSAHFDDECSRKIQSVSEVHSWISDRSPGSFRDGGVVAGELDLIQAVDKALGSTDRNQDILGTSENEVFSSCQCLQK